MELWLLGYQGTRVQNIRVSGLQTERKAIGLVSWCPDIPAYRQADTTWSPDTLTSLNMESL
jgi:hypothetical protein